MSFKKPANQDSSRAKSVPHIASVSIFTRSGAKARGEGAGFARHLTFKNIVFGLGLATFLIFLGSVVSARIAFLFAALLGLAGLMLLEMASRRKWEAALLAQLQRMETDYERMVREVARNRNEVVVLKRALAGVGSSVRNSAPGDDVEQRMLKSIGDQLSRLDDRRPETPPMTPDEHLLPDLDHITSIDEYTDEQIIQLVHAAVRNDRIDLFLQPIVNLPQRKTRFYEMLSRIRIQPDMYLPAERYIAVAMQQDLVPMIDNLLLLRGLQFIRDTEEENANRFFFCNITSLTLNDPKFMGDLVEFIAHHRTLAPRLVFELGQRDLATMSADILPVLQGLAQLGCRFSMDQVRSLSFDFAHLEARHIRFIKADAALVLRATKETGGLGRLRRLKSELDHKGIDFIIEKIEDENQMRSLLDVDFDFGQGYLFGHPMAAQDMG